MLNDPIQQAIQRARLLLCYASPQETMERLAQDFGREVAFLATKAAIILDGNSLTPKFDLN